MILILLQWLFIFITCLGTGYFLLSLIKKFLGINESSTSIVFVVISGLFFVVVAGSIVSFFLPLDAWVRYFTFLFSIVVLALNRKQIYNLVKTDLANFNHFHILSKLIFFAIFFIALIKSTGPSELIDEGGYYLPYIRWIEEFRLTPGLANVEDRMGFNSTFHLLSAFFSMREWHAEGLYDLNGFLLILFCSYFIGGFNSLINFKSELTIAAVVKTFCLYFLFRNMLTSSSVDLANVFIAEMALVVFIEKITIKDRSKMDDHFIILFLLTVLLTTIKLSSVGLLLLPLFLLFYAGINLKKSLLFTAGTGLVVMVLWLTRFYFLTGYIVFPVYHIDLFDPQWKVPMDIVRSQYFYVKEFARVNAAREVSEALSESWQGLNWVPVWFGLQNAYNKITALALLVCSIAGIWLLASGKLKRSGFLYLAGVLLVNLLLWFFTFPAFRFGWAFIIVFIAIILSLLVMNTIFQKPFRYFVIVVCLLFTAQSMYKTFRENHWLIAGTIFVPVPLPAPEILSFELTDGFQAKKSTTNECWGASPPCFPLEYSRRVKNIGTKVADGYYINRP